MLFPASAAADLVLLRNDDGQPARSLTEWVNKRSAETGIPLPDRTVYVSWQPGFPQSCGGDPYTGCASTKRIILSSDEDRRKYLFAHELGHVFDFNNLTHEERTWYAAFMGYTDHWFAGTGVKEFFANSYRHCLYHGPSDKDANDEFVNGRYVSSYGYTVTREEYRRACWIIGNLL